MNSNIQKVTFNPSGGEITFTPGAQNLMNSSLSWHLAEIVNKLFWRYRIQRLIRRYNTKTKEGYVLNYLTKVSSGTVLTACGETRTMTYVSLQMSNISSKMLEELATLIASEFRQGQLMVEDHNTGENCIYYLRHLMYKDE